MKKTESDIIANKKEVTFYCSEQNHNKVQGAVG